MLITKVLICCVVYFGHLSLHQIHYLMFEQKTASLQNILKLIPENLLATLSKKTKVDHYANVLYGERMFNLLLYGILTTERTSQRTLEDIFKNELFKNMFCYEAGMKISRSSISARLGQINSDFFRLAYERIYTEFSKLFNEEEQLKYKIVPVDSTMVAESCNKLMKGLTPGNKSQDSTPAVKQMKYTMAFDGLTVCALMIFSESRYTCENNAIPEVVMEHALTKKSSSTIYVMDRGVCGLDAFNSLSKKKIQFVGSLKTNRKYFVEKTDEVNEKDTDLGTLKLISSQLVYLYPKQGKQADKENVFRWIIAERKEQIDTTPRNNKGKYRKKENLFYFITNNLEITPIEIADIYKQRWNIEVFFRFIKQELNASHFLSVNENGISVILYMTLIASMLLLMYKNLNDVGYKTAKRRMMMEATSILLILLIIECGGDPEKLKKVHLRNIRLP